MTVTWFDTDWGSWVLGDMADALRSAADLLGRSVSPQSVILAPPSDTELLPKVSVVVGTPTEVAGLKDEVEAGEFIATFDPDSNDDWWMARVAGMRLEVSVPEVMS